MFERRRTRQITVGRVPVGGGTPITVQSMTTTKTADVEGTLQQIYALYAAGCDIVRCTCNEAEAANDIPTAVVVHAHLALLWANVRGSELTDEAGNVISSGMSSTGIMSAGVTEKQFDAKH